MLDTVEPLPARAARGRAAARPPGGARRRPLPGREEDERGARRRLAFEELFLLQLAVAGRRAQRAARAGARGRSRRAELVDRWRWSLPFELTERPGRGVGEIDADLGARAADAAAADGRGRERQDRRRPGRDAARRRERRARPR